MKTLLFVAFLLTPLAAPAWDGYDYETNSSVEIEKGNTVRRGREIEYYDYGSNQYKTGDVESVRSRGSKVEVEVYDNDTGQTRTFEMDRK